MRRTGRDADLKRHRAQRAEGEEAEGVIQRDKQALQPICAPRVRTSPV